MSLVNEVHRSQHSKKVNKTKPISENELWVFFEILLGVRLDGRVVNMWDTDSASCDQGRTRTTNYSELMTYHRFKDVRSFTFYVFADSL